MKRLLLLALVLGATLQGCRKDDDSDMYTITISRIDGDVSDVENVTVSFELSNNYYGYAFDPSGMDFKFPLKVSAELSLVGDFFDGTVSDPEARWGRVDFFGYKYGQAVGQFVRDVSGEDRRTVVDYVYVDRDVTVSGSSDEWGYTVDVDLELKAGWNRMAVHMSGLSDIHRTESYNNDIPPGVRWRFVRFPE